MRNVFIAFFLVVSSLSVFASPSFTFIDAQSGVPIPDSYILLRLYDARWVPSDVSGSTVSGSLSFTHASGEYAIGIYGDNLGTPGKDYYRDFRAVLSDSTKLNVQVLPVGSVQGRVLIDNVIASHAKLSFDCEKDFSLKYPTAADDLGYFSIAYFPIGKCVLRASSGGRFEIVEFTVAQGEKKELVVELKQSKASRSLLFAGVIVALIVILVLVWKMRRPKRKHVSLDHFTQEEAQAAVELIRRTPKETVEAIKSDKRISDILATLSEDEADVVNFLVEHRFKASQPTIANKTGIPKTSLARQLIALEGKKILVTRKERKVKVAELTDWFLEGYKAEE